MPQIDLVISEGDRLGLFTWALSYGCLVVPDMLYPTSAYAKVCSLSELDAFPNVSQFWVLREDWMSEDLQMRPVQNKHVGAAFYIAQRIGGPAIRFLLYKEQLEQDGNVLACGSVDHYPTYYSSRDNSRFDAPDALKSFYKEAVRHIRSQSIRIVGQPGSAWISRESARLVVSKVKRLPVGFNPSPDMLKGIAEDSKPRKSHSTDPRSRQH